MSGMHAIMCQFTSVWKEISGLQRSKSLVGKGRGGQKHLLGALASFLH